MLLDFPSEIFIKIMNFLPLHKLINMMSVSREFEIIMKNTCWKIPHYVIMWLYQIDELVKLKLNFKELMLCGDPYNEKMFVGVNLKKINYETLHFYNIRISLINLVSICDVDSTIFNKCKKLKFSCCSWIPLSFIISLQHLKKCESIKIAWETGDDYLLLVYLKTLPKLQKISLMCWSLDSEKLALLSNYHIIKLSRSTIDGDIESIKNYSKLILSDCYLKDGIVINKIYE